MTVLYPNLCLNEDFIKGPHCTGSSSYMNTAISHENGDADYESQLWDLGTTVKPVLSGHSKKDQKWFSRPIPA